MEEHLTLQRTTRTRRATEHPERPRQHCVKVSFLRCSVKTLLPEYGAATQEMRHKTLVLECPSSGEDEAL